MKFADLDSADAEWCRMCDRAARIAASKAPAYFRMDVYQDAWERFLRNTPLTFGGA